MVHRDERPGELALVLGAVLAQRLPGRPPAVHQEAGPAEGDVTAGLESG
ncbi:MAG: hypothetical protein IPO80_09990 [Propionibacteriaceae bacterium]|nr:hypothetical protein [Propionibacteriaceae bacterium]